MTIKASRVERMAVKAEERDADLAFDPTIKRECYRIDCKQPGAWRPVLLLQPGRDYTGKPMRFPLGIVVCDAHRAKTTQPDQYLTEDLWNDLLSWFRERGVVLPHRASTRLDFDRHGPPVLDS